MPTGYKSDCYRVSVRCAMLFRFMFGGFKPKSWSHTVIPASVDGVDRCSCDLSLVLQSRIGLTLRLVRFSLFLDPRERRMEN